MRLIEKVWFNNHPAKLLLIPLLLPLTVLFWLISSLRRISFKLGLSKSFKVSKPVIIVGNIGVGGNGKTPVVIYLIALTRSLGLNPGVISRGYGGQAPHYPYLLDESSTAFEAGDEPILIKQRCQVPVAVGGDRIASAELLIDKGCDIIISDDGLQHYRLQRDIELIVVDAKRLFGNGLLLPAGPLREGKWRLRTSDLILLNGKSRTESEASDTNQGDKGNNSNQIENSLTLSDNLPQLTMTLAAMQVCNLQTGACVELNAFVRDNKSVNAIAGIGDPQRFFDTLSANNFVINIQQGFVDHHSFSLGDFDAFDDNIPLLMTEKDAVKCRDFCQSHWWYLPVDAVFSEIEQQKIIDKIKTVI